jgi:hypothetical protein
MAGGLFEWSINFAFCFNVVFNAFFQNGWNQSASIKLL